MKASRLSFLLLGSALVLALPSFAGNTVKKSLEINDKVTVQGVQLLPGNYKIEWTEPGPKTEVSILRGRDLLATVPAQIVSENIPNEQSGYGVKTGMDGHPSLTEIFFSGEKYQLELGAGAPTDKAVASGSRNSN